jgi:hypothetical protein
MSRQRKRIPGEPNPEPDPDPAAHIVRESQMTQGLGRGDYGIACGIFALIDWHKRRRARKLRNRQ